MDRPRGQPSLHDEQQLGQSSSSLATQTDHQSLAAQQQQQQQRHSNDLIDVNWHSISVQSSDSTSLTVQNLSQDTTYEFYVRAKNIIGDGPRSQVIQTTTKRAISGSVTPISSNVDPIAAAAASTEPYSGKCSSRTQDNCVYLDLSLSVSVCCSHKEGRHFQWLSCHLSLTDSYSLSPPTVFLMNTFSLWRSLTLALTRSI